jgi:hypothetical protein
MKKYYDYLDDEYDENLFLEREIDEKAAEDEEKPSEFIEGEKDPVRIYLKEMSSVLYSRER